MRLTNYSDFALRTLMYLAVMPDSDRLATISDIAESYQISKSHLTKVIYQLAQLGYIDSVRGKHGGIRLAKPADKINLGEVIRHTEPDFAIVPCMQASQKSKTEQASKARQSLTTAQTSNSSQASTPCTIHGNCQLQSVFSQATLAFLQLMDGYTLADLTSNPNALWQQLHG